MSEHDFKRLLNVGALTLREAKSILAMAGLAFRGQLVPWAPATAQEKLAEQLLVALVARGSSELERDNFWDEMSRQAIIGAYAFLRAIRAAEKAP